MENVLIFGHKNPDTDSIVSSIVMSIYNKYNGWDSTPVRLGEVNKETKFVLNYLGIEEPKLIESVKEGQSVILVDHNEFSQSVSGIEKANIIDVIDHHRICDFVTKEPIYYTCKPYGCTGTILYEMFMQSTLGRVPRKPEKLEATLMLSAIISDTLLFKSPTCTEYDKKAASELAEIAGIDINTYGMDMLKAGTDLSSFTASELIKLDAKESIIGESKIEVAQVNTVSIEDVLKNKEEIEKEIQKTVNDKKLDLFIFVVTDILNCNSQVIVLGEKAKVVEKAYNVKLEDNMAYLKGVVSRKKQIIPVITENM